MGKPYTSEPSRAGVRGPPLADSAGPRPVYPSEGWNPLSLRRLEHLTDSHTVPALPRSDQPGGFPVLLRPSWPFRDGRSGATFLGQFVRGCDFVSGPVGLLPLIRERDRSG